MVDFVKPEDRLIRGPDAADDRVFVPSERVLTRNSGCWNCRWALDAATYWKDQRVVDLQKAVSITITSPMGENDPRVLNLRKWVTMIDAAVANKAMLLCKTGKMPNGDDVTPLVTNSFMCRMWTGTQGASVARGTERINDLAEEIREKIDGPAPTPVDKFIEKNSEDK